MLEGKHRYRCFLANQARRLLLRRLESDRRRKIRRRCKALGVPFIIKKGRAYKNCLRKQTMTVFVPRNFELLKNFESIFNFVNDLVDMHSNRKLKQINLDMTDVNQIDSSAVCLLLSVISELTNHGINVVGNYPKNKECAKIFMESGFLAYMKDETGHAITLDTPNLIVETGKAQTRNREIAKAIKKSMLALTGVERRFQPAYTVAMEICSNSVEHAYGKRPKHWRLGAYKLDDRIAFTMSDTGVGILNTLYRKFRHEIVDKLRLRDNTSILYRAFKRKYGSSTQLVNRNKGLPCILDKFENGYIKNLKVLTNDVFLDFKNKTASRLLKNPFSGVLFYWEIDLDCLSRFDNDIIDN